MKVVWDRENPLVLKDGNGKTVGIVSLIRSGWQGEFKPTGEKMPFPKTRQAKDWLEKQARMHD